MNPLDEKANTLSRCGSFYYRTLIDESKADAEFVSHAHSYTRLMPLGNKITTAIKGGCYYEDYYKIIKFTDRDIDWNGVKQALQYRVRGGMGNITSELEYVSSSKARELGTSAWVLLKEDVPTGLIDVASVQMQTLSTAPVEEPVFLQVYIIDPEGAAIHLATSTQSVTLAAGEFAEWSFAEALIGTDIYKQNSQIAFQFTTNANSTWQDDDYVPAHLAVGAGAYVPAVQFYRLAAAPALPSFNRPSQLTIRDHFFMGNDISNILSKEGTSQPIAFPGEEEDIELPETQELIWDLHIDKHIMVTSIKMDDGTMLYANQDFASQFGKLTFLKNPIALFPKMQFMAQSYTGRMPNLYNYLVRADEVYGSIGKMMNYMRGSQSIKSLYHASAQAAGLAVIEKDCTVVAVSPLLEGKLYITTAGRYEANYPHTPLKPGTKLPKDYIIGGNQLYRLIGPYDPMPSNVTGINLGSALPVPGLVVPNEDITLYNSYGLYAPAYKGENAALSAYHTYLNDMSDLRLTKFSGKNAVQVIKPLVAQNKDFQIDMWFSIPSAGQTYTLEFDSGRLELVWEERSRAKLTGVFLNATNDEVTSLSLTPSAATAPAASKFLNSTDQAILQQLSDVRKRRVVGTSYTISYRVNAEVEALSNFSTLLPAYPGDNYILRLKYNSKTKELLFVLYYSVQWMFSDHPVTGQSWQGVDAVGYVYECITITIKNWNIQSLQRVYTTDSTDDTLSNYFSALIGEDRSFTAVDSLEITNGINYFRYTACPNRCVVACINESYMTSQMKLRLMTYLQRELPIGSVLTTANLPNIVNETPELTLTFEEMYPIIATCHIPNDEYVDTGIEFEALDSYDIEVKANFATFASRYNGTLGGVNVPTSGAEGYAPARCIGGASTYAYTYSENWELLITRPADAIEPANQIVYKFNSTGDTTTQFQGGDKVFMLGDGTLQAVPAASPYLIDKGGVPEKRTYWIGALHTGLEQQAHYTSNAYHAYWKFTKHDTGELVAEFIPAKNVFTGQQGFINTVTKTFYPCKKLQ